MLTIDRHEQRINWGGLSGGVGLILDCGAFWRTELIAKKGPNRLVHTKTTGAWEY